MARKKKNEQTKQPTYSSIKDTATKQIVKNYNKAVGNTEEKKPAVGVMFNTNTSNNYLRRQAENTMRIRDESEERKRQRMEQARKNYATLIAGNKLYRSQDEQKRQNGHTLPAQIRGVEALQGKPLTKRQKLNAYLESVGKMPSAAKNIQQLPKDSAVVRSGDEIRAAQRENIQKQYQEYKDRLEAMTPADEYAALGRDKKAQRWNFNTSDEVKNLTSVDTAREFANKHTYDLEGTQKSLDEWRGKLTDAQQRAEQEKQDIEAKRKGADMEQVKKDLWDVKGELGVFSQLDAQGLNVSFRDQYGNWHNDETYTKRPDDYYDGNNREDYDAMLYDKIYGEGAYEKRVDELETDEQVTALEAKMDELWSRLENKTLGKMARFEYEKNYKADDLEALTTGYTTERTAAEKEARYAQDQINRLEAQERFINGYYELMGRNPDPTQIGFIPENDRGRDNAYSSVAEMDSGIKTSDVHRIYSFINKGKEYMSWAAGQEVPRVTDEYSCAMMMSDKEIAKFNDFYNKGEYAEAGSFLKGLQPYLRILYDENFGSIYLQETAHTMPVLSSVASQAMTMTDTFIAPVREVAGWLGDKSVNDPSSAWYKTAEQGETLMNTVAEDLGAYGKTYLVGMNSVRNVINGLLTKGFGFTGKAQQAASLLTFASQIYQESTYKYLKETRDYGKTRGLAALDAIMETAEELLPYEAMLGDSTRPIMYFVKNSLSEAGEEFTGATVGTFVKGLITGRNEVEKRADEIYNEGGYYDKNGKWVTIDKTNKKNAINLADMQALREWKDEVKENTIAGAAGGGLGSLYGGISSLSDTYSRGRNVNSKRLNAEGKSGAQRIYELAMSMGEDTESRKLAEKIKATEGENVKVGNFSMGKLAQALAMDTQEKYNQTIQDTIAQDVEAKLAEAGVAGPQAKAYSEIITRSLFSGEMTKKDIQTLARNEQAIEVWKKYNVLSEEEMNLQKQIEENTKPQKSIMEEIGDLTSERAASTSAVADEVEKSIRSTKTVEEALADLKTRRNDLMSDMFEEVAQQILKDNPQAKKSKNFVDDVMKIRLAAMTLNENMPAVMLDAESARKLYEESRKEFDEIDEKRIVAQEQAKPGEGVTTFDGAEYGTKEWLEKVKGLTKTVKNQLGAIAEINARMGLKVNVVNDTENTNIYGFEDNDGTITINAAGMNRNGMNHHMLVTLSHEMTHWLEQNSREGYNALRKYVVDGLRKNGQNVEQMIVKTIDNLNMVLGAESGQSLDLNGAMAEIVAKGCENLLCSQTMANELKDTNPSLYSRIKTFVKDFVARLREAIKGMEGSLSFEARTLSDQTENIAKIWLGARQEALNREQQETETKPAEEETSAALESVDRWAEEQTEQPEEASKDSMSVLDEEYSKAVEDGNTRKQQELVEEAAKAAGYTEKVYHGTTEFGFTEFDMEKGYGAIFTSYDFDQAQTYTNDAEIRNVNEKESEKKDGVYALFAKKGNQLVIDAHMNLWSGINLEKSNLLEGVQKYVRENMAKDHDLMFDRTLMANPGPDVDFTTREIAAYAKDAGYDSLRINNVMDDGGLTGSPLSAIGDVGVFFNPNDVKSADAVTYDDNGKVIPPSERFNEKKKDIRFSVSQEQLDDEYMKAVEEGNTKKLEKMVEGAAKKAFPNSRLIWDDTFHKMWHHTNAEFTEFLPGTSASSGGLRGIYFTPQEYSTMSNLGTKHKAFYLNVENLKFAFGVEEDEQYVEDLKNRQKGVTDREELARINRQFKEETGVDAFFDWQNGWYNIMTPEQIKSADPITYDDDGNVIPLSERFNMKKKDYRYSIEDSPDMDVNNFMMGLQEHNLPMAQERTMLRQYKKLYSDTEAFRYFINELKGEIRKIEAKGNISAYDRMQLEKKQRMIDNYQARVERNQQELIKVTQSEGFARLMMKQHGRMTNLISGRTAGQLESTVEAMNAELENVSKEMAARKERLKKLGMAEGVLRARTQFNRAGLSRIAEQLKNELGSELSTKEIENRLALIALKMKQGSMDTENVQELADLISGRMTSQYEGYVISELRGSQITLSPVQMKELKASGSSLQEVRSKLAGTGIRIGTKGSVTLDQKWDSLCDMIPSLNRDENAGNMLNVLLDKVTAEKRESGSDIFSDEGQMKISESILKAANQLIPEIVTDQKSLALIRETLNYVREISEETSSAAEGMDEINSMISRLQRTGRTATKQAGELTGNITDAIDYFNALSEQSEAAMWQQERRELIDQLKSENTQKMLEEQARWNERVAKDKAVRETIENNMRLRKKITTNVSRIRKLLVNESDQRNIPEHMKGLAREMLEKIVDNDLLRRKISGIYEQDLIDLRRVLNIMKEQDGEFSEEDLKLMTDEEAQAVVMDALADLEDGIELYNERNGKDMMANISRYRDALVKMADAISTITNVINAERSISTIDRQIAVSDAAEDIAKEMENSRFKGELTGRGSKAITTMRRTVVLGNMTPEYLIKNLKNNAFEMLWDEAKSGENRNGLETQKAQDYIHSLAEKTKYRDWVDRKYNVTLGGKQIEMSIDNMMELYAIWKREHTTNQEMSQHLSIGGVYIQKEDENTGKLRREKTEQRAVRVTDDEVQAMYDQMTDEQKEYLEGIVRYLSNEMSALGNEASMRMYGIKKYKESYYFPMKVWDGVKSARSDRGITGNNENRAANKSWSKRRMNMARNALVIGNFTQDAVNHIVEMINYNTMAPAIENINKVLNYKFVEGTDENDMTKRTLRIMFQQAYGKDKLEYLETLLKDMNGGVTQDQRKTLRDRALTIFKKNAVAGSMSVALQQPLSIIRAAMIINPKYLAESVNPATWKGSYTEMNKYSGVAVIKNMGRFDMNFGQSAKDYISPETKQSVYEKTSDALTKIPQLMDTMTWTRMWTAVKLEQAAKHPDMDTKSEKFLNMVGERFNEVMRRTQVYDSILVKSSNMRSQNMGMKLITSFMAEPTLSLNVLADAVQNFREKGGKANFIKAGATFLLSAVMQAAVKAGMGSGRSPDKKKTGWENFLNKLAYNLMNETDIAGLIPGYSDIIEVLKTGELKDDAMGAIGKLFTIWQTGQKAVQKMAEGKGQDWYSWFRDIEDTAGQFAQLFTNIPAKNLMRDMRAMYNWISGSNYADRESSAAVIKYQTEANLYTGDNLLGVLEAWLGEAGFKTTNTAYYNRIYNAMKTGDTKTAEDLKEYLTLGKGTSEDSITSGLKAAAKKDKDLTPAQQTEWMYDNNLMGDNPTSTVTQQYKEGKITKAEATKLYRKLKPDMTDDDIWWKFDQMDYNKETGADVSGNDRYYRLKDAISVNKVDAINKAVKDLLDHGIDQKKVKEKVNTEYKSEYLAADTNGRLQIRQAMHKVYKAIGLDAKEADKKIEEWKKEEQKKKKTK